MADSMAELIKKRRKEKDPVKRRQILLKIAELATSSAAKEEPEIARAESHELVEEAARVIASLNRADGSVKRARIALVKERFKAEEEARARVAQKEATLKRAEERLAKALAKIEELIARGSPLLDTLEGIAPPKQAKKRPPESQPTPAPKPTSPPKPEEKKSGLGTRESFIDTLGHIFQIRRRKK